MFGILTYNKDELKIIYNSIHNSLDNHSKIKYGIYQFLKYV